MANPSRDTTTVAASPSSTSSRASLSESRSPPQRNPSLRLSHMPSAAASHRQSFSDIQRHPPSPRANRQPSISQLAVQDLYDNPPHSSDSRFAGRDWRSIQVNELTSPDDLRFVEADTSVEDATNVGSLTILRTLSDILLSSSSIPALRFCLFGKIQSHIPCWALLITQT